MGKYKHEGKGRNISVSGGQERKDLFKDWLKQNDKLGGQHKIPRLSNSREFLEKLLKNN